jgi:hypothetical protein
MHATFAANLLGRSDSLTVANRAIAITRQGNGNFAVTVCTAYKDGKRGQSQIGFNHKSLASAEAFASEEAGRVYGGCKVVVLPSALAA